MQNRPRNNKNGRNRPSRILLRWHRRLGEAIGAILLVLCATGLFLNHSEDFNLRHIRIQAPWLLDWYGLEPVSDPVSYSSGQSTVSWLEGTLYFNGQPRTETAAVLGVIATPDLHVVASGDSIILLARDGELVERLTSASLPHETLVGIGIDTTQQPAVNTPLGIFTTDDSFLEWKTPVNIGPISWSKAIDTPPAIEQSILEAYRGNGLSAYRVILDIHTGRFFGDWGKWIADLTVIGLILLTLSGLYYAVFLRKKQRRS